MAEQKKAPADLLDRVDTPLAYRFTVLAKKYYGAAFREFEGLDLDRNFFILNLISKQRYITQQGLANCLGLDKASIVRIIDHLSDKGLVKREPNPDDRREHRIVATSKAATYAATISKGFSDLNKTALKGFTKEEKMQFNGMMDRVKENLSGLSSEVYVLKYIKKKG